MKNYVVILLLFSVSLHCANEERIKKTDTDVEEQFLQDMREEIETRQPPTQLEDCPLVKTHGPDYFARVLSETSKRRDLNDEAKSKLNAQAVAAAEQAKNWKWPFLARENQSRD